MGVSSVPLLPSLGPQSLLSSSIRPQTTVNSTSSFQLPSPSTAPRPPINLNTGPSSPVHGKHNVFANKFVYPNSFNVAILQYTITFSQKIVLVEFHLTNAICKIRQVIEKINYFIQCLQSVS